MNQQNQSFEQNMQRLEQIVRQLEKGDAPLEESLTLFQEGTKLIGSCSKALDQAQQQLKILLRHEDGPELADFVSDEE